MAKEIHLKGRDKLPSKRTINLAGQGVQEMNYPLLVTGIIIIVIAAVLFSKFAVVDVLNKVYVQQNIVSKNQAKIEDLTEEIEAYGDMQNEYAHYTYSDFTKDELNRADRMEMFDVLETYVLPNAKVTSVSIYDNRMDVPMIVTSLQSANQIMQTIEQDDRVDYCELSTAELGNLNNRNTTDGVTAQISIYMIGSLEGGSDK